MEIVNQYNRYCEQWYFEYISNAIQFHVIKAFIKSSDFNNIHYNNRPCAWLKITYLIGQLIIHIANKVFFDPR